MRTATVITSRPWTWPYLHGPERYRYLRIMARLARVIEKRERGEAKNEKKERIAA